jgi:UDP-N-acetylglucosamine:LPS N-acetylglucosamine transferase
MNNMSKNKNKVVAIASEGGHWIQLMRLKPCFDTHNTIYVSTNEGLKNTFEESRFYKVQDANRWNKLNLIKLAFQVLKVISAVKPDYVVTTGAAPGLFAVIFGRLYGAKTLWIDSIANAEEISLSGRLARLFSTMHLTQWPELAKGKTLFKGNVIS